MSDNNKFNGEILNKQIKENELFNKFGISGFIYNSNLDKKIATLAIKAELKSEQDKITKLKAFDSVCCVVKLILTIIMERFIHSIVILNRLIIPIIFYRGNQKDCPMKKLNLLLHLIIVLLSVKLF